jgi:hypothetical protein
MKPEGRDKFSMEIIEATGRILPTVWYMTMDPLTFTRFWARSIMKTLFGSKMLSIIFMQISGFDS